MVLFDQPRAAGPFSLVAFHVFMRAFYALVLLDCVVAIHNEPGWLRPSTLRIARWSLFGPLDISQLTMAYHVTAWASALAIVSPRCVFPFVATVAAAAYSTAYFGTIMNRFQHTYLVCLVLWILIFAWKSLHVRWMLQMQLAVVYFFTAMAKLSGTAFVSGDLLPFILMNKKHLEYVGYVADTCGVNDVWLWRLLSGGTILLELLLATLWATGRYPGLLILGGVALHVGIKATGSFRIGFFVEYMLLCYLLPVGRVVDNLFHL